MRNVDGRIRVLDSTHRNNEGVSESGGGISELMAKLDVVVVQPTTGDFSDAVESSDAGLGEETRKEVANNTANGVSGEDLD